MSDKRGPWDLPETPAPPTGRRPARSSVEPRRLWLWLMVLAAIGALTFGLARAYPEALHDNEDKTRLALQLGIVLLVSTALLRGLQGPIRQHLKHVALWSAIIAVLVLGYAYRAELATIPQRVALAFNVGTPVQVGERTLVVPQGEDGAYVVDGLINGQRVRFVVDTGATGTVLTPDDARRLGIPVDTLNYGYKAETANGVGYSAAYDVNSLEVGAIKLDGFRVMVNQAPMHLSLLGMTFLHRLDAFEFRDRQLILKWREDGKGRAY